MPAERHPLVPVLQAVHGGSCPHDCNFHCHSTYSDGSLAPEELGRQAVALGLSHLAVTDHHSQAAYAPLRAWLAAQGDRAAGVPTLWTGMEISCLLEGCLVHVLALGYRSGARELDPYSQGCSAVGPALAAGEVVRRVHDAGGLVLLAHPARYRLPFKRLIQAAAGLGFDGAEAFYDYEHRRPWRPTELVCDAIAEQLATLGLLHSCGTDTHGLELHGR